MFTYPRRALHIHPRLYASASSSNPLTSPALAPFRIFDRHAKLLQKNRAAALDGGKISRQVDYVRDEVANRMIERFMDIKRQFVSLLDLGSGPGHFSKLLPSTSASRVTMLDISDVTLHRDPPSDFEVEVIRKQVDEEQLLETIERNSQDAVVSCLSLHWVNDLPGVLIQIREVLRPDGVFIAAMFGGDTLFELRTSLQLAELEREGGISPRVSPMTDTRDVSNIMGRAGFTLLTVDIDEIQVTYPTIWELVEDLRNMGESNAIQDRRHMIHRDTLLAASSIYSALHANEDGTIPATFEVIYMIGWKPSQDQPKPLQRGSGQKSLKDVL